MLESYTLCMYYHPCQAPLRSRTNVACFTFTWTTRAGIRDTYTPKRVPSPASRHAAQGIQPVQPLSGPSDVASARSRFSDATHPVVDPFAYPAATTNRETGHELENAQSFRSCGCAIDESGRNCMCKCRDRRSSTQRPYTPLPCTDRWRISRARANAGTPSKPMFRKPLSCIVQSSTK
jgi:hypothetical protein